MRRLLPPLLFLIFLLAAQAGNAQSPPGINYQGIARNPDGKPLSQRDITIRINILDNGAEGVAEYAEVHSVKTNTFGLFTLVIGTGSSEKGYFDLITWSTGNKWLRVEMDPDGGNSFQLMGAQQLMSVPYAFYAKYSDSQVKAGQGISIANNVVTNTGDADADATNELVSDLKLGSDHVLRLTEGTNVKEADLSSLISVPIVDKDEQQLSITNDQLKISNGNSVDLSPYKTDNDNQDLSLVGNSLSLTKDPTPAVIDLSPYKQNLSLSGNTLNITNGTGADLTPFKQDLALNTTTHALTLTNDPTPTSIDLKPYMQSLHLDATGNSRTITIDNGVGIGFTVDDGDSDLTNELQQLSYNAATKNLSISGSTGNSVVIPETQNLNQVLQQGNDANAQRISNIGLPVAANDATSKQYVDATDASITARINANYAFKTGFNFSTVLAVSEVTLPLSDTFDDFNVVNSTVFTAPTAGTYVFVLDGNSTGLLASSTINLNYNGTKYPVTIGMNTQFNSTFMFRLSAGQMVSVVATGLAINTSITGSFFGYKLL